MALDPRPPLFRYIYSIEEWEGLNPEYKSWVQEQALSVKSAYSLADWDAMSMEAKAELITQKLASPELPQGVVWGPGGVPSSLVAGEFVAKSPLTGGFTSPEQALAEAQQLGLTPGPIPGREYLGPPAEEGAPMVVPEEEEAPPLGDTLSQIGDYLRDQVAPGETKTFTVEQAAQYGVTLEEGWTMEVTGVEDGAAEVVLVDASGWRVTGLGEYISPEGERYTEQQLLDIEQDRVELETALQTVFPQQSPEATLGLLEIDQEGFLAQIREAGRTPETETILRAVGVADEQMAQVFGEVAPVAEPSWWQKALGWIAKPFMFIDRFTWTPIEIGVSKQVIMGGTTGLAGFLSKPPSLQEIATGITGFFAAPRPLGEVVAGVVEQIPAIGGIGISAKSILDSYGGTISDEDREYMEKLVEIEAKYGSVAMMSQEAQDAYWEWGGMSTAAKMGLNILNPVYMIPVGGTAALIAKPLRTIPVLGKTAATTARAAQILESIPTKILGLPFKAVRRIIKGVPYPEEAVRVAKEVAEGKPITDAAVKVLEKAVPDPKNAWLKIPTYEEVAPRMFKPGVTGTVAQTAVRIPAIGNAVRGPLWRAVRLWDPRVVLSKEGVLRGNMLAAARSAQYFRWVQGMGAGLSSVFVARLRNVISNPIRYFGIDRQGITKWGVHNWAVLENPKKYNIGKVGERYAQTMHEIIDELVELKAAYGVVTPRKAMDDFQYYIHRVCTGQINIAEVERITGVRFPAVPKHMRRRMIEQPEQAVQAGLMYARNPEAFIVGYTMESMQLIAEKLTGDLLKRIEGVVPAVDRYALEEFDRAVNAALRGKAVTPETLANIEKNFGELGKRFKNAVETPKEADQLRAWIKQAQLDFEKRRGILAKESPELRALAEEAVAKPVEALPKDDALKLAFESIDYEDRSMFRSVIETQRTDLEMMRAEFEAEMAGLKEFFETDPVAAYRAQWGKRQVSLTTVLTSGGEWPRSITKKQAEVLLMGRELKPAVISSKGRVMWEYIIDEMADHFHMTEKEFIQHIENLRRYHTRYRDLGELVKDATARNGELDRLLRILGDVDASAANIPAHRLPLRGASFEKSIEEIRDELGDWMVKQAEEGVDVGFKTEAEIEKYLARIDEDELRAWHSFLFRAEPEKIAISADELAKLQAARKAAGLPGLPSNILVDDAGKAWRIMTPLPTAAAREQLLSGIEKQLRKVGQAQARTFESVSIQWPAFRGWQFPTEVASVLNFYFLERSNAFLRAISDVAGVMRMFKATADFSVLSIQLAPAFGWFLATGHPVRFLKAMAVIPDVFYAFARPGFHQRWITANERAIMQRTAHGGSLGMVEWFEALGPLGRTLERIPFVGAFGKVGLEEFFGRFNVSFAFALDYMRQATWDALAVKAVPKGEGYALAQFCDHIVGVFSSEVAGVPLWFRNFESAWMWFAPRYLRACVKLVGDIFVGGFTTRQAAKALGGMMAGGALVYYAMCKVTGQEPHWNPLDSRFLQVKIGDEWFGIGGFWRAGMRLEADIIASAASIGWNEPIDLVTIVKQGGMNKDNPWLYWLFNRTSSVTRSITDMIEGQDFMGHELEDPMSYVKYIAQQFTPIPLSDWSDVLYWEEEQPSALATIIQVLGLNARQESPREAFFDEADKYIAMLREEDLYAEQLDKWRSGDLHWRDLDVHQQALLKLRYPELEDLEEAATQASLIYQTPLYKEWWHSIDAAEQQRLAEEEAAWQKVLSGEWDLRTYRERMNEINTAYGTKYSAIANNPRYAEIYAEFERSDIAPDANTIEMAWYEYQEKIIGGDFETDVGFNYDLYRQAIDQFKAKWGEDVYHKVLTVLESEKLDEHPTARALWADRRLLDEYWGLPDEQQADYRRSHPEVDATLALWGYGGKLQTPEGYRILKQKCADLSIPFEPSRWQLPPENLIEAYFDYQKIPYPFQGYERERFLMENRDYYEWGRQTYGWKEIDFSKVPTVEVEKMWSEYQVLDTGNPRLEYRCKNPDLDAWLVSAQGYTPAYGTDRCSAFTKRT